MSSRWWLTVSFVRVIALASAISLFFLGVKLEGLIGAQLILAAAALFVASVAFSFWLQNRILAVNKTRATEPEVRGQLTRRMNRQTVLQRVVFGVFLAGALAISFFVQGPTQLAAVVLSIEILISVFWLEFVSRRFDPDPPAQN